MEKCPDCKKYWETNWRNEEYCPNCGQTKAQAVARAQRAGNSLKGKAAISGRKE